MESRHGFFSAVLDLSFSELVTARHAKELYTVAVGGAGLLSVAIVLYGLSRSPWLGILSFLVTAPVLLFVVIVVRLGLEAGAVLMRIAEQTEEIAEQVAGIAVEMRPEGSGTSSVGKDRLP